MNPLTELNQVIASMESGIEDEGVDAFEHQLSLIQSRHPGSGAVTSIIEMMRALGRYLRSRKNSIHKDTLPSLTAIAGNLETLVREPDLNKDQAAVLLAQSSSTYKALKTKITSTPQVSAGEMQKLKEVILAIDWEISNETLEDFDRVTTRLMAQLKPSKILYSYLKIINSLGRYIASKKALAHPDSLFFLHSVFENFERVVQTPGMSFQEKKQLVERDVAAFMDFKKKVAGAQDSGAADPAEELRAFRPALSHVRVSRTHSDQKVVPLEDLPRDGEKPAVQAQDSHPGAAKAGQGEKTENQDIMGELFNPKESPADKMLDFIHLSGVHGGSQSAGMNMDSLGKEDLQKNGFENFIPQRMDTDPIPEIRSRLDAFFSPGRTEAASVPEPSEGESHLAAAHEPDSLPDSPEPAEPLIIFREVEDDPGTDQSDEALPAAMDNEKDLFSFPEEAAEPLIFFREVEEDSEAGQSDETPPLILDNEKNLFSSPKDGVEPLIFFQEGEDPIEEVLKRFRALAESQDPVFDQEKLKTMEEDLSLLHGLWQEDPDKTLLVDVLFRLIRHLQVLDPEEPSDLDDPYDPEDPEDQEDQEDQEEISGREEPVPAEEPFPQASQPLESRQAPKGWKKRKFLFFSRKK